MTHPSWATIAPTPCISITCIDCKQDLGEDGTLHFPDLSTAREALEQDEWTVLDEGAICSSCADDRECLKQGHVWDHCHRDEPFTEMWICSTCSKVTAVDPAQEP